MSCYYVSEKIDKSYVAINVSVLAKRTRDVASSIVDYIAFALFIIDVPRSIESISCNVSEAKSHEIFCCCSRNNICQLPSHPSSLFSTFSFSFSFAVVIFLTKCLLSPSHTFFNSLFSDRNRGKTSVCSE